MRPIFAQIETNTYCNRRCWFCPNAWHQIPTYEEMDMELYEKILVKIRQFEPELQNISFAAYNEPTLDPWFRERLLSLKKLGFRYWFFSNATGLIPELTDWLIGKEIPIYEFIFNVPEYNSVIIRNLRYFATHYKINNVPVAIVIHGKRDSEHEEEFKRIQRSLVHPMFDFRLEGYNNRAGYIEPVYKHVDHGLSRVACSQRFFNNIYIGVRGNLYLCCQDFFQIFSYGNIKDISELWDSEIRKNKIEDHRATLCRKCSWAIEC